MVAVYEGVSTAAGNQAFLALACATVMGKGGHKRGAGEA